MMKTESTEKWNKKITELRMKISKKRAIVGRKVAEDGK